MQAAHIQDREQGKAHPLQKPEYCISTLVEKGKWGRDGTGFTPVTGLWSELTKERMTQDVRKVQSIYRYPKQLYNAFDRVSLCPAMALPLQLHRIQIASIHSVEHFTGRCNSELGLHHHKGYQVHGSEEDDSREALQSNH